MVDRSRINAKINKMGWINKFVIWESYKLNFDLTLSVYNIELLSLKKNMGLSALPRKEIILKYRYLLCEINAFCIIKRETYWCTYICNLTSEEARIFGFLDWDITPFQYFMIFIWTDNTLWSEVEKHNCWTFNIFTRCYMQFNSRRDKNSQICWSRY